MKVIIDTNLLFSAVSKPDGRIAEIILNPHFDLQLIGCYFSYIELFKHKEKLLKASKLTEIALLEVFYQILKQITFFNESQIPTEIFAKAYILTKDIDEKDTVFIALSMQMNMPVWSGDKQLTEGLYKKGFYNIFPTDDLMAKLQMN